MLNPLGEFEWFHLSHWMPFSKVSYFVILAGFLVHLSLGVFLGNPTEKDAQFLRKGQRGAWEGLGAVFASLWLAARTFLILGS